MKQSKVLFIRLSIALLFSLNNKHGNLKTIWVTLIRGAISLVRKNVKASTLCQSQRRENERWD